VSPRLGRSLSPLRPTPALEWTQLRRFSQPTEDVQERRGSGGMGRAPRHDTRIWRVDLPASGASLEVCRQQSSPAHVADGIVGDDRAAVVWAVFSVQTAARKLVTERMSRDEEPTVTDELLVAIRAEWEAAGRPIVRPHAHRDEVMFADGITVVGVRSSSTTRTSATRRQRSGSTSISAGHRRGTTPIFRGSTSACPMPPNCASHSRTCWTAHAAASTWRSVASEGTGARAPLWHASL